MQKIVLSSLPKNENESFEWWMGQSKSGRIIPQRRKTREGESKISSFPEYKNVAQNKNNRHTWCSKMEKNIRMMALQSSS